MVYSCCVPGCNTDYRSFKTSTKISSFRFPTDENLKKKWISSMPRQNWTVASSHKVCQLHFEESDFIQVSVDKKNRRRSARDTEKLRRPRLKNSAIPHIFSHLPQYMSKEKPAPRLTAATSSARLAKQNAVIDESVAKLSELESFDNFGQFKYKIQMETLPNGFVSHFTDNHAWFYYISENAEHVPTLLASVLVTENLDMKVYVRSAVLPYSAYQHLMPLKQLKTTTQFSNMLSLCKSLSDETYRGSCNFNLLKFSISILEQAIAEEIAEQHLDNFLVALLKFVVEQLKLVQVPKHGRRYSSSLITTSFLWQMTSSSLYKKLRHLLILPSLSLLRKLSSGMTVQSGKLDLEYLKLRQMDLTDQQKIVVLLIDEVYTAQRVEYNNGTFVGVTENGSPAKTVLAFMVQSLAGKYKDVVCLIPVNKLDTALLRTWFDRVMVALDDMFLVLAVSTDNHVCNRLVIVLWLIQIFLM